MAGGGGCGWRPSTPAQLRLPGPGGGSHQRRVQESHRATLEPRVAQLARAGLGAGLSTSASQGQQPRGFLPPSSLALAFSSIRAAGRALVASAPLSLPPTLDWTPGLTSWVAPHLPSGAPCWSLCRRSGWWSNLSKSLDPPAPGPGQAHTAVPESQVTAVTRV